MINVVISGNKGVQDGLLILALSYTMYNKDPITIYFLTADLSDLNPKFLPLSNQKIEYIRKILKNHNPESDIKVVDLTDVVKQDILMKKFRKSIYSPYALLRLYSDKVNGIPDKVLYLDTDVMILGNIKPLFILDIEDYEFAGAPDYLGQKWISVDYQNSGVLLMNMKKIKETQLLEKCRHYLVYRHPILADQDALNFRVQKKKFFTRKYNEQYKKQDNTVIRHFTKTIRFTPFFHIQNVKPWMVDKVHKILKTHDYDEVLNKYLAVKDEYHAIKE